MTKRCPKCKEHLPRSAFPPAPPSRLGRDGLKPYCYDCMRLIGKERYARNPNNLETMYKRVPPYHGPWTEEDKRQYGWD